MHVGAQVRATATYLIYIGTGLCTPPLCSYLYLARKLNYTILFKYFNYIFHARTIFTTNGFHLLSELRFNYIKSGPSIQIKMIFTLFSFLGKNIGIIKNWVKQF